MMYCTTNSHIWQLSRSCPRAPSPSLAPRLSCCACCLVAVTSGLSIFRRRRYWAARELGPAASAPAPAGWRVAAGWSSLGRRFGAEMAAWHSKQGASPPTRRQLRPSAPCNTCDSPLTRVAESQGGADGLGRHAVDELDDLGQVLVHQLLALLNQHWLGANGLRVNEKVLSIQIKHAKRYAWS